MRRRAVFLVGALVLMAMVSSAAAQSLSVPPGRWWQRPKVVDELGLTTEQRDALETVTLAHARTMVDLKAAVEKAQLELRIASEQEPFDAAAVRLRFGSLQQARLRLESERFEMLVKTREIVTPAQWKALSSMARERRAVTRRGEGRPGESGVPRRPQGPRGY